MRTPTCSTINTHKNYHMRRRKTRTFLLFLMVTRCTPGTGFIPSLSMAFLLFFSLRLCLDLPSPARKGKGKKRK